MRYGRYASVQAAKDVREIITMIKMTWVDVAQELGWSLGLNSSVCPRVPATFPSPVRAGAYLAPTGPCAAQAGSVGPLK